jgi:hypothetical protein
MDQPPIETARVSARVFEKKAQDSTFTSSRTICEHEAQSQGVLAAKFDCIATACRHAPIPGVLFVREPTALQGSTEAER